MNPPLRVLALAALCSAIAAQAQEGRPPGARGGHGAGKSQLFVALDANADGVINEKEMANAAAAFKKVDKNGDGKISEEEARPAGGGRPQEGGRQRGEGMRTNAPEMVATLMQFDKNADGKLTRDEVPERMQGIFERGDKNKDGALTVDELKAAAEAQAGGAGGPQR